VETVWELPRPKFIVSVTGGAQHFTVSSELDQVLSDLMHFARRTEAWLTTGGTDNGIMKYFGENLDNSSEFLCAKKNHVFYHQLPENTFSLHVLA
jgi:hypothetical protein